MVFSRPANVARIVNGAAHNGKIRDVARRKESHLNLDAGMTLQVTGLLTFENPDYMIGGLNRTCNNCEWRNR
jgi:hypothetical protein